MTDNSSHRSARAVQLAAGVVLAALVCQSPSSAGAQSLSTSPAPRPTLGVSVIGMRGDRETGTGIGGRAQVRWPVAPHLSLIGSVGGVRFGAVERQPPAAAFAIFSATARVWTALTGIETARNAGTLQPYASLAAGVSMVRTRADVIGIKEPVGQIASDVRRIEAAPWGTPSAWTPTLVGGGGVRVRVARQLMIDASLSRFESGRITWATSPGFGGPTDLRRRTSAWLIQAGTAVSW